MLLFTHRTSVAGLHGRLPAVGVGAMLLPTWAGEKKGAAVIRASKMVFRGTRLRGHGGEEKNKGGMCYDKAPTQNTVYCQHAQHTDKLHNASIPHPSQRFLSADMCVNSPPLYLHLQAPSSTPTYLLFFPSSQVDTLYETSGSR